MHSTTTDEWEEGPTNRSIDQVLRVSMDLL